MEKLIHSEKYQQLMTMDSNLVKGIFKATIMLYSVNKGSIFLCNFKSVAMLRYLAREKAVDDHWYPRDLKSQAKVDEYLEWQHVNTRLFCAMFFQHKVMFHQLHQCNSNPQNNLLSY